MCDQLRLRPACAYAQSDQSICLSLEYSMTVQLLTEYHVELLGLNAACTSSFESTLVKIPHCWKSHIAAHISRTNSTSATKTAKRNELVCMKFYFSSLIPSRKHLGQHMRIWYFRMICVKSSLNIYTQLPSVARRLKTDKNRSFRNRENFNICKQQIIESFHGN